MFALMLALLMLAPPQRIVSTAPSITEILFALGLGSKVAGVSTFCAYPLAAKKIAKVGTYARPNAEVILAARPDLIILQRAAAAAPPALVSSGARILEVNHTGLASIYDSIRAIGEAAGVTARADLLAAHIRAALDRIRHRVEGLPRRRVLFLVGRTPGTLQGLVAAGGGSYLDEIIRLAGGVNVMADSVNSYPRISLETVLSLNPEVIIDMGDAPDPSAVNEARSRSVTALWRQAPAVRATVFPVASEIFVVPGPRVVDAAEAVARMIHPEAGPWR